MLAAVYWLPRQILPKLPVSTGSKYALCQPFKLEFKSSPDQCQSWVGIGKQYWVKQPFNLITIFILLTFSKLLCFLLNTNVDLRSCTHVGTESHGDWSQVFVTCIFHFCHFSSEQKGHVNRSRGQIYRQIAGLASFPRWQDLTVASLAKLSCYWCLISLAQGSGRNSPSLGMCPRSPLSVLCIAQ